MVGIHGLEQLPFFVRGESSIAPLPRAWLTDIQYGILGESDSPLLDGNREEVAE